MLMRFCFVLLIPAAWAADKLTAPHLIDMARHPAMQAKIADHVRTVRQLQGLIESIS
jgi:hypothetical protein